MAGPPRPQPRERLQDPCRFRTDHPQDMALLSLEGMSVPRKTGRARLQPPGLPHGRQR